MPVVALERPDTTFKIFQFPPDMIPRVDGDPADWTMVPADYAIGIEELKDTVHDSPIDTTDLDVTVRVGWVKGLNRLYFLYEAYDDYWDFSHRDLHNDILEIVVDGDLSGGPLIPGLREDKDTNGLEGLDGHFKFHGVHAQNYHIFTPAEGKDWTMVWGCQPWIKDLPYANAACKYNFRHGESGKLVLEFFVTPFDHAPPDPARAIPSKLFENKVIGMSWAVLDYDDEKAEKYAGFWNLSHKTTMYGNASDLVAFRLKPMEKHLRKQLEADWSFQVVSRKDRVVAFRDQSHGSITSRRWDFGDGKSSTERHPTHRFEKPGEFIVTLHIKGPKGEARRAKIWDVTLP